MNILIAADSFKDALPALEVCQSIARGIWAVHPDANIRICPLADGGEGTYEVLAASQGLQTVETTACDPRFLPLNAVYGITADGSTAFIEMAKTAGLQLIAAEERNPLSTSTFGVGQQISDALHREVRHLVLAIGGSATNDAGIGMAAALGWQFLDENGQVLSPVGGNLSKISVIIPPLQFPECNVEVICDVNNPLYGPMGAANIYARQKGADAAGIRALDEGLKHFAAIAAKQYSTAPDPEVPGAGAAGGMGFGALFFLNASLRRGAEVVLDLLGMDEKLEWADRVVTGEGKIDGQSAYGKLVQSLCSRAAQKEVPVIALCGQLEASDNELREIGLEAAFSINEPESKASLAELLKNTGANLERTAAQWFQSELKPDFAT